MYAIISKGELLALCERPRYVKRNAETGAYVEAAEAEAIGIAVGGEVYNLPGGTAIPDAPEALAQEGEAEEYVFRNHARIIENEETTNAAFAAVEEAMCELDSSSEGTPFASATVKHPPSPMACSLNSRRKSRMPGAFAVMPWMSTMPSEASAVPSASAGFLM